MPSVKEAHEGDRCMTREMYDYDDDDERGWIHRYGGAQGTG